MAEQEVKFCDRCNEQFENGKCPICSQQYMYVCKLNDGTVTGEAFPLAVYRGRTRKCAVVDVEMEKSWPHDRIVRYLTACGDVIAAGCSVYRDPPTCKKCRHILRNRGADDGSVESQPVVPHVFKGWQHRSIKRHGRKMMKDEIDGFVLQPRDVNGHGKRRRKRRPSKCCIGCGAPSGNIRHVSRRNGGRKDRSKKRGGTAP